jgi:hypothetical protein
VTSMQLRPFPALRTLLYTIVPVVLCSTSSLAWAKSPTSVYHPAVTTVRATALEKQVIDAVKKTFNDGDRPPLALDRRLVDAAHYVLGGTRPTRNALMAAGLSDSFVLPVQYTIVALGGDIDPIDRVRSLLETDVKTAKVTHFGVGIAPEDGRWRVVIVFVRRRVRLSTFPKRLRVGERFLLNGNLDRDLTEPIVLVATPTGHVREQTPRVQHGAFWTMLPFDAGEGRYIIEVQAKDSYGEQVLSLLEVFVDDGDGPIEVPMIRLTPNIPPPATVEEAELRAMALINRVRRQAGLTPLRNGVVLQQEAKRHVLDMSSRGYFGHISPRRGDLARRLQSCGLQGIPAGENIAVAATPEAAHAELMRSPSHLRNIVDPNVTHVGVGAHRRVVGDSTVYTFSQIFASFRP